jgi:hypothetical protein
MKRLFAITALMTGLWCGTASAQWVFANVNPQSIGPVAVTLYDDVSGACWTNLREVREYAEEKLRMSGYEIRDDNSGFRYELGIHVLGYRNRGCIGSIRIELMSLNIANRVEGHILGEHVVARYSYVANDPNNLNNVVIEVVQELIDEL